MKCSHRGVVGVRRPDCNTSRGGFTTGMNALQFFSNKSTMDTPHTPSPSNPITGARNYSTATLNHLNPPLISHSRHVLSHISRYSDHWENEGIEC